MQTKSWSRANPCKCTCMGEIKVWEQLITGSLVDFPPKCNHLSSRQSNDFLALLLKLLVEKGHGKDVILGCPGSWSREWQALHLPLDPWNVHSSHSQSCFVFFVFCFQGHSIESTTCCCDHLDGINDWTLLRPLYNFQGSGGQPQRSTHLVAIQDKLPIYNPLLNKTATYQSGEVCFFLQSLLALLIWRPIQMSPGKLWA